MIVAERVLTWRSVKGRDHEQANDKCVLVAVPAVNAVELPGDFRPRRGLGQHFLRWDRIADQLLEALAPGPDEQLVEIGPGLGALSDRLAPRCRRLELVELDSRLAAVLEQRYAEQPQVRVHCADALSIDFASLVPAGTRMRLVGNLPYNISTPLLFRFLQWLPQIQDMHFMLQTEVAQRLAAPPGDRNYGRLSVAIRCHCQVQKLFGVPPQAFSPRPKVHSTVLRLVPLAVPLVDAALAGPFQQVLRLAFGQRRKTLRNALRPLLGDDGFSQLGIDGDCRAGVLDPQDYVAISRLVQALGEASA